MQDSGKVAIATFVMRNKEYLVAIRPEADVLALETMYFADEVRSPTAELPNLPGSEAATAPELKMANLLIDSMEGPWEPERYHDTHRAKVEALIEEKAQGKTIAVAQAPPATKVIDLMEALSASIKQSAGAKSSARAKSAGAGAGTRATKPAAKRGAATATANLTPVKKVAKAPAVKTARRKAS
jgi:DNA end-binding protein Ku